MKIVISIICLCAFNFAKAQPIGTPTVDIDAIYFNEKQLYFNAINNLWYESVSKKEKAYVDKKNSYISTPGIRVNTYTMLIKNKDTMQVKLIFKKHSYIAPVFVKMQFIKGTFIIDMNECVKEKGFTIKNFPCDCMAYRKEEEEK